MREKRGNEKVNYEDRSVGRSEATPISTIYNPSRDSLCSLHNSNAVTPTPARAVVLVPARSAVQGSS